MKPFAMLIPKIATIFVLSLASLASQAELPLENGRPSFQMAPDPTLTEEPDPATQRLDKQELLISDLPASIPPVLTQDMTVHAPDLWARMRRGFAIPDLVSPTVDQQLAALKAHPKGITTMLLRGRKYLYHIVVELEKRGMPTELALLPLVESAYNPMAFSSANAAGLWQFIPSTGRSFSLEQNWWVDERRDVLASTDAALTYLQTVYELQGDWHLALASYNWGENAVMRAVASNRNAGKPTDFNDLKLPRETALYVPKFEAIKMIIAHPEQYGIKLPEIPNQPYFVTVERTQAMDVAVAARLAEMPLSEFQALNPAFNRPVILGNHASDLLLPIENADIFKQNLAKHSRESLINWKTYSLPRAAYIEQVAQYLKISTTVLCSANGLPARTRLAAGYTLLVPENANTNVRIGEVSSHPSNGYKPPRVLAGHKTVTHPAGKAKASAKKRRVAQSSSRGKPHS